jgi:hypothetical protein
MKITFRRAACILAGLVAAVPALAESSASTAASATSSAVGSLSNSLQGSSNSSSKTTTAAAGDYRIDAVTVAADRPGMVRLALQPLLPTDERQAFVQDERQPFVLVLPQRTAEQEGLTRGDTVSARARPYGIEFSRTPARQAFFLVVADAWLHDLDARPVSLAAPATL